MPRLMHLTGSRGNVADRSPSSVHVEAGSRCHPARPRAAPRSLSPLDASTAGSRCRPCLVQKDTGTKALSVAA